MKIKERVIIIECFSSSLNLKDEDYETEIITTGQKGLNKIILNFSFPYK
ncbi:hypothetical protein LCGC14_0751230 [marine sediment metagenome]|uniref:Uncharacterized protein n=1 Tax=marine sediment metagenome TaxID=412755 RepID=A0A0F9TAV6_9ZZZZ|nr:MAG: hypothetical protein Lokiarch_29600 [Candidatus Lokiarchaeum sp. GC14_75]